MKEKTVITVLLFIIVMLFTGSVGATVLPLPEIDQETDNWCWAACTQSVLNYYGHFDGVAGENVRQCNFAEELRLPNFNSIPSWFPFQNPWALPDNTDCCFPNAPQNFSGACNQGNRLSGRVGDVKSIFLGRGLTSDYYSRSLNDDEVRNHTDSGRPLMIGWDNYSDNNSQHVILCRGRELNQNNTPMIFAMDPSPNTNNYVVRDRNWFLSATIPSHTWMETLAVTSIHNPPPSISPQVSVNGVIGNYTARYGQYINVTASLNPNGYTDNADWWVALADVDGRVCWQMSPDGWACPTPPDYAPIPPQTRFRKPLTPENFTIWSGIPSTGTYTIYFGADLNPDGILNNPAYYSYSLITIQP